MPSIDFMGQTLRAFLELIKFRYHLSFLGAVLGAFIFAPQIDLALIGSLIRLYVVFNLVFYTGLYTLNDLRDVESDRAHPSKKNRPLPSGRMNLGMAWGAALTFILLGLALASALFGVRMVLFFLVILLLNIFYSFLARNVVYLDLVCNSATHPVRFLMGVSLTGDNLPLLHAVAFFFFIVGLAALRREVERDVPGWEARSTLRTYSESELILFQFSAPLPVFVCATVDAGTSTGFYLALILTYLTVGISAHMFPSARLFLRSIWTK